jgi:hypothetical protein
VQFLEAYPDASPDWTVEQTRTQWANFQRWLTRSPVPPVAGMDMVPWEYFATVFWALTIAALSVTEVWTLVWLAGRHSDAGDGPALAWLSVVSCALGMVLLLTAPTLRLLWFQIPSGSDLKLPDTLLQALEGKFGLPTDASEEERKRWFATMNQRQ